MCDNNSIMLTPVITGAYQDSSDAPLIVLKDLFIPLITLDTEWNTENCNYLGNFDEEKLPLFNFDQIEAPIDSVKFTIRTTVKFKIEKGNKNANKEEGGIMITSNQVNMVKAIYNNTEIPSDNPNRIFIEKIRYGDTFEIEIEPYELQKDSYSDAYILFQYYEGDKPADCGKTRFTNTSKVGKRLIANIEVLPTAPASYISPSLWRDPQKSFKVANKYINCKGMCYAVTMARVNKAYEDVHEEKPLNLDNVKNMDYYISGTTAPSIPDTYLGYGVGGALANNNKGKLVSETEIWNGKLEEGAILQYWIKKGETNWEKYKAKLKKSTLGAGVEVHGHSFVFKTYIYNNEKQIVGLKYYDYEKLKILMREGAGSQIFLVGANLLD